MPFSPDDIVVGLACGPDDDGRWHGWFRIEIRAEELRRLGLHPDQRTSTVTGASPPAWWHAAAELACARTRRSAHRHGGCTVSR